MDRPVTSSRRATCGRRGPSSRASAWPRDRAKEGMMGLQQQMPRTGENRTSLDARPAERDQMEAAARQFPPSSSGDGVGNVAAMRRTYGKESAGLGHVPRPQNGRRSADTQGIGVALLDNIGARIAFERSGTRLWRAVLDKLDTHGSFPGGPAREDRG